MKQCVCVDFVMSGTKRVPMLEKKSWKTSFNTSTETFVLQIKIFSPLKSYLRDK